MLRMHHCEVESHFRGKTKFSTAPFLHTLIYVLTSSVRDEEVVYILQKLLDMPLWEGSLTAGHSKGPSLPLSGKCPIPF